MLLTESTCYIESCHHSPQAHIDSAILCHVFGVGRLLSARGDYRAYINRGVVLYTLLILWLRLVSVAKHFGIELKVPYLNTNETPNLGLNRNIKCWSVRHQKTHISPTHTGTICVCILVTCIKHWLEVIHSKAVEMHEFATGPQSYISFSSHVWSGE